MLFARYFAILSTFFILSSGALPVCHLSFYLHTDRYLTIMFYQVADPEAEVDVRGAPTRDWRRGAPTRDWRRGAPTRDWRRGAPTRDWKRESVQS